MKLLKLTTALTLLGACVASAETIETRMGPLEFTHDFENGYPTAETQEKLFDEMDFQRATQAYIWGIPIVAFAQWQKEHEETFGANSGDIVYYPHLQDKYGLLTANATTPYTLSFIRLDETGPVVIDMPEAEVRGAMHSMWQIGLTQMTEPGRYVFHAPGTEAPMVEGAKVIESSTNSVFFGIRLLAKDEEQQKDLVGIRITPLAKANDFFNPRLEQSHYVKGSAWEIATTSPTDQRWEHHDALDGRAAWFYEAVTNDKAMFSQTPGKDQIYLASYRDSEGDWLDGGQNYMLNVPADVPAAEFWSLTVYDVSSRAPIVNDQQIADKSSRMDLDVNEDGSVTLYIGPDAPDMNKTNWIPTVPNRAWFPYFRFYSPTEPYFDRSWILPDIQKTR